MSDRMAQLWRHMARIYGDRWTSQFGDCDDGTWGAALAKVPGERIAEALKDAIASGNRNPPTLPEFVRLCAPQPAAHRLLEYHPAPTHEDLRRGARMVDEVREKVGIPKRRTRDFRDWRKTITPMPEGVEPSEGETLQPGAYGHSREWYDAVAKLEGRNAKLRELIPRKVRKVLETEAQ